MRVQIILALVAALVLVAVPLYLWRRPQPANIPSADAATSSQAPAVPTPTVGSPSAMGSTLGPAGAPGAVQVEVAPVKTLKCQDPGPGRTPTERCDGIRYFEDGLTRAIKDSAACAPPSKNGYVVSYVLEFHFGKKRTNLFLGKSTTLSKSKRKELLRCVERGLTTPDWDRIPHQHLKYTINAVASYPPSDAMDDRKPPTSGDRPHSGPATKAQPKKAPPKKPAPKKKAAPSKKAY